jgi:hypothetical protein
MRLRLIPPQVKPTEFKKPLVYPHKGSQGSHCEHYREVDKPLKELSMTLCPRVAIAVCDVTVHSGRMLGE